MPLDVAEAFATCSSGIRARLMDLRAMIFRVAQARSLHMETILIKI
jgi:hypothetical protein